MEATVKRQIAPPYALVKYFMNDVPPPIPFYFLDDIIYVLLLFLLQKFLPLLLYHLFSLQYALTVLISLIDQINIRRILFHYLAQITPPIP